MTMMTHEMLNAMTEAEREEYWKEQSPIKNAEHVHEAIFETLARLSREARKDHLWDAFSDPVVDTVQTLINLMQLHELAQEHDCVPRQLPEGATRFVEALIEDAASIPPYAGYVRDDMHHGTDVWAVRNIAGVFKYRPKGGGCIWLPEMVRPNVIGDPRDKLDAETQRVLRTLWSDVPAE
jgi:hypothetical protein